MLYKYQSQWSELHKLTEENAIKAEVIIKKKPNYSIIVYEIKLQVIIKDREVISDLEQTMGPALYIMVKLSYMFGESLNPFIHQIFANSSFLSLTVCSCGGEDCGPLYNSYRRDQNGCKAMRLQLIISYMELLRKKY